MGRGRSFSEVEIELLKDNYDKTIAELEEILLKNGYKRSRKSINRKIEKLREDGEIGLRSKDTIRRSYRQRNRNPSAPSNIDEPSFGSGFGEGFSKGDGFGSGFSDEEE